MPEAPGARLNYDTTPTSLHDFPLNKPMADSVTPIKPNTN